MKIGSMPAIGRHIMIATGIAAVVAVAVVFLVVHRSSASSFVEYRMRQSLDMPIAIAAAPDGTMWFTLDLARAIGRVRAGQLERLPTLLETNVPGVYAVGDVRSGSVKRVASSVGEGSVAVQFVHQYLSTL